MEDKDEVLLECCLIVGNGFDLVLRRELRRVAALVVDDEDEALLWLLFDGEWTWASEAAFRAGVYVSSVSSCMAEVSC
jgi:hypothetical protein